MEYQLRSFSPWLTSILLDVAMGGDVVQDPAQVIFIISKNPYSTKPAVILNFFTPSLFLLELYTESVFFGRYRSVFLGIYHTDTEGKLGQYFRYQKIGGSPSNN